MSTKREMTSFEYSFLLEELQSIIGKKINKIYELENNLFRFKITKEDLVIELGKRMHLTKFIDQAPERPTNFTMFLRKKLKGAIITKFYQYNTDRVFVIECKTKEGEYKIILEMFSKGNLIILDTEDKIISPYHREDWKDRIIRRNKKYTFPQNKSFSFKPSLKEIEELLDEKYTIVCLSKLPIGTVYIKEILKKCEINEKKEGNLLTKEEKNKIIEEIEKFIENAEPNGFLEEERVIDFSLLKNDNYTKFASLNKLLDKYYHIYKEETEEEPKSIKRLKNRLEIQKKHRMELAKKEKELKKTGDKIYEKYDELEKLIKWINKKIEEKKWEEIEKELKKINITINKKTKEIEIEFKN